MGALVIKVNNSIPVNSPRIPIRMHQILFWNSEHSCWSQNAPRGRRGASWGGACTCPRLTRTTPHCARRTTSAQLTTGEGDDPDDMEFVTIGRPWLHTAAFQLATGSTLSDDAFFWTYMK